MLDQITFDHIIAVICGVYFIIALICVGIAWWQRQKAKRMR